MIKIASAVIALTFATFSVNAWNSLGHRAVAELAWRHMDAAERQAATDLLKQHPHYKNILTADVPAGVDTNEWAFLTAAVWPDLVRPAKNGQPPKPKSVTKYNVYPHGIELPFLLPGEKDRSLLKNYSLAKTNGQTALMDCIATLKNRKASAHDRAVSLCVVLHLYADLHQPLHASALVTKEKPGGFGGGGGLLVRNPQGERVGLHAFWDQLPGSDLSYRGIMALADELAADPALQPKALKEYRKNKRVPAWVRESWQVAAEFAYDPNRIQYVEAPAAKARNLPDSAIPEVSAQYAKESREIARKRLALAALRLTDALKGVW